MTHIKNSPGVYPPDKKFIMKIVIGFMHHHLYHRFHLSFLVNIGVFRTWAFHLDLKEEGKLVNILELKRILIKRPRTYIQLQPQLNMNNTSFDKSQSG